MVDQKPVECVVIVLGRQNALQPKGEPKKENFGILLDSNDAAF